jgi:hypothetical protein
LGLGLGIMIVIVIVIGDCDSGFAGLEQSLTLLNPILSQSPLAIGILLLPTANCYSSPLPTQNL